ncbi:arylsulfatase A-like enzyme [Dyadobacter jejuensis]|uniref:Arylsulfatase A-like enzyme n=1 Tax=Dyadobacter jejuensis TaxID=1082580 RepID=A0A316AT53_9BACT|nr:sulfatase [Dyadobacter jejuensis]PWJ60454.1 arylsulfatase A-like enzyme [Dyadobacter jejuensis]
MLVSFKNSLAVVALLSWTMACQKTQGHGQEDIKRPNILFCIADDASYQHMSAYGLTDWVQTPAFDEVAAAGVLFLNAYTPNAKCAPSRSCILTGRNPWQLEEAANHVPNFPAKFTTWMEALGANGYQTGYTGKGWSPGNPGSKDGKPRLLTGKAYQDKKLQAPTSSISSTDYAANFKDFLDQRTDDSPFCFWYGGHEPHRSYAYGSGLTQSKKKLSDIDKVPAYWPDNETVRTDMLDYAFEVEYFDQNLGKILSVLKEKGELENTIVIVTSDNGMPFPRVKGHVYEYDNHLPLAIMWPKGIANKGRKIEDFVSFNDFAPTILEAAGVSHQQSTMQEVEGKSLLPLLQSSKSGQTGLGRDHMLVGKERTDVGRPHDQGYPVRGIIKDKYIYTINYQPDRWPGGNPETGYLDTDGSPTKTEVLQARRNGTSDSFWKLAFGKKGSEELYRFDQDPDGVKNLANDPAYKTLKASLKKQLEEELKKQKDPRMFGNGAVFDNYPYSEAKTRNFYERYMRGEDIKAGWVNETDFEKVDQ